MKKKSKKKKRNKSILVFFILFIILIICYIFYKNYYHKLLITMDDKITVEINSEVKLKDIVKEINNGKLMNGDIIIDTTKLGIIKEDLLVKDDFDKEKTYSINIEVIDTTKPEITAKESLTTYVTKDIDLLANVTVKDNSKEEIKAKVIGNYDINKEGKYNLKYVASDSSNNKNEYDFILNIISDDNNKTFTTSKGYQGKTIDGVTYIDGTLIVNKTYSLPSSYGSGLTSETQNAFNKMQADAKDLGLNLWLSSGYRSYYDQQYIYNNYVQNDGEENADTYSARAGHSEHQTGLAFDLNTIDYSFSYTNEGKWVHDNCYKYGLILRYPKGKESITGYMYESWHMRYVGVSLATKLYNDGDWITLEEYYGIDSKYN